MVAWRSTLCVVGVVAVAYAQGRNLREESGDAAVESAAVQLADTATAIDRNLASTRPEVVSDDSNTLELGQETGWRQLKKRKQSKKNKAVKSDVCAAVLAMQADKPATFSSCMADPFRQEMLNQLSKPCLTLDKSSCKGTQGCMWVGKLWAWGRNDDKRLLTAGRNLQAEAETCIPDPCFRINNGKCTIQNTGGRCVWYTKEQNRAERGLDHPGCYQSPCNNPEKNNPNGCLAMSNSAYQCTWCGPKLGCMNAELTSQAQCWNIGRVDKRCDNCKSNKMDGSCPNKSCETDCCMSPFCDCTASNERSTDTALSITG